MRNYRGIAIDLHHHRDFDQEIRFTLALTDYPLVSSRSESTSINWAFVSYILYPLFVDMG